MKDGNEWMRWSDVTMLSEMLRCYAQRYDLKELCCDATVRCQHGIVTSCISSEPIVSHRNIAQSHRGVAPAHRCI